MSRPRIGFLGTGWIGRHRMEAMIATGAIEAAAICDPSPECVANARALAPEAELVGSPEALFDCALDGVVIATPSALHAGQAIAALDRGLAVFCQKPIGRNAAEVGTVIEAARRADRLLGGDFSYRHTAATAAIMDPLRSGEIGRPFAVDLVFHNAYGPDKPWFYDRAQSGGGCVMDLGVHLVDLALWAFDFPEVDQVTARLYAGGVPMASLGAVEDYAVAELLLANGVSVRLACSWRLHAGQEAVIGAGFHGTDGGLALRNVGGSFYDFEALRFSGTAAETLVSPPDAWGGRAAADWAMRLADDPRFDREAERFSAVAAVVDRIYKAALDEDGRS